jgi:hypothetical protein
LSRPPAKGDHLGGPPPDEPFKAIVSRLNDVKEIIAIIVFFAGGFIWVVNYFATQDALEALDCFTRVNVRFLQANDNYNFLQQQAKSARSELRDLRRLLDEAKHKPEPSAGDLNEYQTQIEEVGVKAKYFTDQGEMERRASTKWLSILSGNACYRKDQRKGVLDNLARGE